MTTIEGRQALSEAMQDTFVSREPVMHQRQLDALIRGLHDRGFTILPITSQRDRSGYRIFIREQSDHYWLPESYPNEEAAMAERKKIKEGPLGGCFMVMVYAPDGRQLTES